MTATNRPWATSRDVAAAVGRRWRSGTLLRDWAAGAPFEPMRIVLRGPTAAELADDIARARAWAQELERSGAQGRSYTLEMKSVGGRTSGRSQVPGWALLGTYDQAWRVLGTAADAREYRAILDTARAGPVPVAGWAGEWARRNPLKALDLNHDWPRVLSALEWLHENRGAGRYLREVNAPGVDTKFIERNRSVLAAILGVSAGAGGFATDLGLRTKPARIRLRFAPGIAGMPAPITEGDLRVEELNALAPVVSRALIIENEISYLSVPVPDGGVVIWGRGYDVAGLGELAWLGAAQVRYWGDLDTYGFAILNRVRAHLPHARSVLMDRATLLIHQDRWGEEPSPSNAHLPHLNEAEAHLYEDLVTGRYGERIRLEQERLDWDYVLAELHRTELE